MIRKDRSLGFKINPHTHELEFATRKGTLSQNNIKTFLTRLAQKAHPDRTFAATYEEMADLLPNFYSHYVSYTGMSQVLRGLIQLRFIERRMVSGRGYQYYLTDKTYDFINQRPRQLESQLQSQLESQLESQSESPAQSINQEALNSNIDTAIEDIMSKVQQVLAENVSLKTTVEQQSVRIAELEQQVSKTPEKVNELRELLSMALSA